MSDIVLKVENLKKKYIIEKSFLGKEKSSLWAIDNISFSINKRETFALVGESGCGKSTTARSILNLIKADGGKVEFEGKTLFDIENSVSINNKEMSKIRKDMQIVFQDPFASLDRRMKVGKIISEGIEKHKIAKGKEAIELATKYLEICGINQDAIDKFPHEFSGGQRQRIGIARALAVSPKLIVADEPVAALDVSIQAQIINLLNELKAKYHLTFLFISHDLGVVKYFCDKIAVMYLGNIVELASRKELFENPIHPYTKMLIDSIPVNHPKLRRKRIEFDQELITENYEYTSCKFYNRCKYSKEECKTKKPLLKEVTKEHFIACNLNVNN